MNELLSICTIATIESIRYTYLQEKWLTQFLHKISYKKAVGLILSENVKTAENIVNMQYQVNPMNQTQENDSFWKKKSCTKFWII